MNNSIQIYANIISTIGVVVTTVTAIYIAKQFKAANKQAKAANQQVEVANQQTEELVTQNKFINDHTILKDAFDRIETYFREITINYKQDSYMTYFHYQNITYDFILTSNEFYLDNKTDFLSNSNDFQRAIQYARTLLDYLEYVVGYFYYKLERISEENLDLILRSLSKYIVIDLDQKDSLNFKKYSVSFLFYAFWCYDYKEEKKTFSYPNLLKFFYRNNENMNESWLTQQFSESESGLTSFVDISFNILEYMFPEEFPQEYPQEIIKQQKEILTQSLKTYLKSCSINDPNFLYFRCFVVNWNITFFMFFRDINIIKEQAILKPILDKHFSLLFTITLDNKEYCLLDIQTLCLTEEDKVGLSYATREEKIALETYYEKYNNFSSAYRLYKELSESGLTWGYGNYFGDVFHNFAKNYRTFCIDLYWTDIRQIFTPTEGLYFTELRCKNELIIKILEECDIVHQMARDNKIKN